MTQNNHSRWLSPSGSGIWFNCPGSSQAQEHHPDLYSEPAEEGTGAHEHAEACFAMDKRADFFIGRTFNGFEVDATQCDNVQMYVDLINSLIEAPEYRFIELQLSLLHIHPDLFGTLDSGVYVPSEKKLYITDFKYGFEDVSAANNTQLWIYGLMMLYFLMQCYGIKPELIEFVICQPRTNQGEQISRQCITYNDLIAFEAPLKRACELVYSQHPQRIPGSHCKHCRGKINCPEYLQWSGGVISPPLPLQDDLIAYILQAAPTVKKLIEQAERYGVDRRQRGFNIPGTKLVRKRKHRKFDNEHDTAQELIEAGASKEDIYKEELRTPNQLEQKFKNDDDLINVLNEHITTPRGDVTIALLEDNRPAIATTQEKFSHG